MLYYMVMIHLVGYFIDWVVEKVPWTAETSVYLIVFG